MTPAQDPMVGLEFDYTWAIANAPCRRGSNSSAHLEYLSDVVREEFASPSLNNGNAAVILRDLSDATEGRNGFCLTVTACTVNPPPHNPWERGPTTTLTSSRCVGTTSRDVGAGRGTPQHAGDPGAQRR